MWLEVQRGGSRQLAKNITREGQGEADEGRAKSLSGPNAWPSAREPESLSAEEKQALEALFEKIPREAAVQGCLRFKEIFIYISRPNHGPAAWSEGTSP